MRDFSKLYKRINKALDNIDDSSEKFIRAKKNNLRLQDLERKVKLSKKLSIENEELVLQVINNISKLIKK